MTILYKYRPLTEFLFKELYYQEIYFASYSELNDPLDLSARIDFAPRKIGQIESLLWFLFKTTLKLGNDERVLNSSEVSNNQNLLKFNDDKKLRAKYKSLLFRELTKFEKKHKFISLNDLENILLSTSNEIPFNLDLHGFNTEIKRLASKFLENSHTTCFSENNSDFLMWSHYASKHSGICLEFTLENSMLFPYLISDKRPENKEEYLKRISKWNINQTIFWGNIKKVNYQENQPHINFFDFSPVFDNEFDCDLIGLSKGWTHGFAYELQNVFSTKTLPWAYEKEWRAIEINFGDKKEPEERINHYPIECLTAIYFGIRTPENVKKRIFKILDRHSKHKMKYFSAIATSGRELEFEDWEYYDE